MHNKRTGIVVLVMHVLGNKVHGSVARNNSSKNMNADCCYLLRIN